MTALTPEKLMSLEQYAAAKRGASIGMGIDHDAYRQVVAAVPENVRRSLAGDLA
jgi:hypothetical protein